MVPRRHDEAAGVQPKPSVALLPRMRSTHSLARLCSDETPCVVKGDLTAESIEAFFGVLTSNVDYFLPRWM